jgi:hypothetical protein
VRSARMCARRHLALCGADHRCGGHRTGQRNGPMGPYSEQAADRPELPAGRAQSARAGVCLTRWTSTYFSGDVEASLRHAQQGRQLVAADITGAPRVPVAA